MAFILLLWLLGFMAQMIVLGFCMYTLIQYSDLENDFINPHDAAANVNRLVVSAGGHGGRGAGGSTGHSESPLPVAASAHFLPMPPVLPAVS